MSNPSYEEPPEAMAFTEARVLTGADVALVAHDVDGTWQFLTGEDVPEDQARLVCLADLLELDASLGQLADLPLGWSAERSSAASPWLREPLVPLRWEELRDQGVHYLEEKQESLVEEFGLSSYDRYDLDQEKGRIWFSRSGKAEVEAEIQAVGSISSVSGTWLWAWANPHVAAGVAEPCLAVRAFGGENGLEKLTREKWPADESDAWELTAVSAYLLEAEGAYRSPSENVALFVLLSGVRRVTY